MEVVWPFKWGGLPSELDINTFMSRFTPDRFTVSRGWPLVRVASQKGFDCILVICPISYLYVIHLSTAFSFPYWTSITDNNTTMTNDIELI